MELVFVVSGSILLAVVAVVLVRQKYVTQVSELKLVAEHAQKQNELLTNELSEVKHQLEIKNTSLLELNSKWSAENQRVRLLEEQRSEKDREIERLHTQIEQHQARINQLSGLYVGQKERNDGLQHQLEQQKVQVEEYKKQLKTEIQVLSQTILEEKSQKFSEQNALQIKQLLEPLGIKIEDFKKQVEQVYTEENKDRATLKEQIRSLSELNQKMSVEAQNLTKALKGDSKTQGNWGEVILERILEKSGLRKGHEFEVQVSERNDEDKLMRPDVVVHLPDNKFLIIDSKVSLTAYENWVNAEQETEKVAAKKAHLLSLRNHVKGLSEKKYQEIHGTKSPDFVLLFIPIQPAFDVALQYEPELYNLAFEKNIILVSPTTLLATLSTVNSVWKQEYQNRHAAEIAEKAAAMYDKFVGFTEDLEKVGKSLETTTKVYGDAMKKLTTGTGNLVRRAEHLKELGIKTTKALGAGLVEGAEE